VPLVTIDQILDQWQEELHKRYFPGPSCAPIVLELSAAICAPAEEFLPDDQLWTDAQYREYERNCEYVHLTNVLIYLTDVVE